MSATLTKPAPQVPRDRYGRPMVKDLETGKPTAYRRVTKFIDVLEDRFALELWKQRQVAHGMAMRPDLVLKAASAAGDKETLNAVVRDANEAAGSSQAATTGTALHAITEQLDRGEEPLIPPSSQPDVDAYRRATEHMAKRFIEVFVVNDPLRVGGTFDRIVEIDGVLYVADVKTGKIDWGQSKIAMQLALYARSEHYDPGTGQRSPLGVDTTRGLVIHLPAGAGECTLHWANLKAGWEGVQIAKEVWNWRGRSGLLEAGPPFPDLLGVISITDDADSLRRLYVQYEQVWTDAHTVAAKARIAELDGGAK